MDGFTRDNQYMHESRQRFNKYSCSNMSARTTYITHHCSHMLTRKTLLCLQGRIPNQILQHLTEQILISGKKKKKKKVKEVKICKEKVVFVLKGIMSNFSLIVANLKTRGHTAQFQTHL